MPKKAKTNKSEKIREFIEAHPELAGKPSQIAATLTKQGVKVSPQYVSTVKSLDGRHKRHAQNGKSLDDLGLELSDILAAKKLVAEVGSLEKAQNAVYALGELA